MRFVLALILLLTFGMLIHQWWRTGRMPTVLGFEASLQRQPGTYWVFLFGSLVAWLLMLALIVFRMLFPDVAGTVPIISVGGLILLVGCFAGGMLLIHAISTKRKK